jgi:hypothetical protein
MSAPGAKFSLQLMTRVINFVDMTSFDCEDCATTPMIILITTLSY